MKRVTVFSLIFVVAGLPLLMSFFVAKVQAPQTSRIYVDPSMLVVRSSANFTVDINIEHATDLHSWQAWLEWDPQVLDLVNAAQGDFLKTGGGIPFFHFIANQSEGWILVAAHRDQGLTGVTGDGTLANVTFNTFNTTSMDDSALNLYDTKLFSTPVWVSVPPYLGDANCDLLVDVKDLHRVGVAYGSSQGDPTYESICDFDGDGFVDHFDLMCTTFNFGRDYTYDPTALRPQPIYHDVDDGYVTIDTTAPITTADYESVWRNTDFTVNLTATDDLSDVAETYYTINNGPTQNVNTNGQPLITAESANNTLRFWSVDKVGNEEKPHNLLTDIKLDKTAPTTTISITGSLGTNSYYTSSVAVTISRTDGTLSGVNRTAYSFDNATWIAYTASFTVTTEGTTTIYYSSTDKASNVETTKSETILLDSLPPSIAPIGSLSNGTEIRSSTYKISWTATDAGSGIDHYEVGLDNGAWTSVGTDTTYTFTGLDDGSHTFNIKAIDKVGRSKIYSVDIIVSSGTGGILGYTELAIIGVAVGVMAVGLFVYKTMRRSEKSPSPARLRIQPEPTKIPADGRSTSTLTIQLLDKNGKPIAAQADTEVKIITTGGKLERQVVKIPKGKEAAKTVLISSTESGTINLSTKAKGLKGITVTLEFEEKPRFCMGCGNRLDTKGATCKKCGASAADFGGPETRTCHCGAVIPATARFCSECGAKQAPTER